MVLTVEVTDRIHQRLERMKRETKRSKSYLVRQILEAHFKHKPPKKEVSHA